MKLIWDNRQLKISINQVDIYIAPENLPPFQVRAFVEEQDTALVLEQSDEIPEYSDEKPIWYLSNTQELQQTHTPGDIIIKYSEPLRLLAVVHDLDYSPSWRAEWIGAVLTNLLMVCNEKELSSIALPVLGSVFGHFKTKEFLELFVKELQKNQLSNPKRIWLIIPPEECVSSFNLLKEIDLNNI